MERPRPAEGLHPLEGYPNLYPWHSTCNSLMNKRLIVATGDPEYPYTGIPASFRNAHPAHAALMTGSEYEVQEW